MRLRPDISWRSIVSTMPQARHPTILYFLVFRSTRMYLRVTCTYRKLKKNLPKNNMSSIFTYIFLNYNLRKKLPNKRDIMSWNNSSLASTNNITLWNIWFVVAKRLNPYRIHRYLIASKLAVRKDDKEMKPDHCAPGDVSRIYQSFRVMTFYLICKWTGGWRDGDQSHEGRRITGTIETVSHRKRKGERECKRNAFDACHMHTSERTTTRHSFSLFLPLSCRWAFHQVRCTLSHRFSCQRSFIFVRSFPLMTPPLVFARTSN